MGTLSKYPLLYPAESTYDKHDKIKFSWAIPHKEKRFYIRNHFHTKCAYAVFHPKQESIPVRCLPTGCGKDEQRPVSSHEADCGQTDACENITFSCGRWKLHNTTVLKINICTWLFAGIGDLDDFGAPPQSIRISPREKEKNKKNSGEKMSKVGSL